MANHCLEEGFLAGASEALPTDPTLYAWPGRELACAALYCGACKTAVRSEAGWAWSTSARPDTAALFGAAPLAAVTGLVKSDTGRIYRCACLAHVEHQRASIVQYRDSERSAVGVKWSCGGHAPVALPAVIAGVAIDPAQPRVRAWLEETARDPDFETAVQRTIDLCFRLQGTDLGPSLTMGVAALLSSDEPRLRDVATFFYNDAPFVVGAERVGLWAAERPDWFAGEAPSRHKGRFTLALIVAKKAVEAGRPYEPPVQELLRREALTEAHAPYLWNFLGWHDYAWFVQNAARFPANVADKVAELVRFRGAPA